MNWKQLKDAAEELGIPDDAEVIVWNSGMDGPFLTLDNSVSSYIAGRFELNAE